MVQYTYPAMLKPAAPQGYNVSFPGLDGCVSHGRTMDAAIASANQALLSHLEKLIGEGAVLPPPPYMGDLVVAQRVPQDAVWAAISVDVDTTSERVNVYLPKSLIERADKLGEARGMSRSSVFGTAIAAYVDAYDGRARAREIAALAWPNVQPNEELMLQSAVRGKVIVVDRNGHPLGLGELGALFDGKPVLIFDMPAEENYMSDFSNDEFDVYISKRNVTHRPSAISISFYQYNTDIDWEQSDSVILRDNPKWPGDRKQLAFAAKNAALAAGMRARKPS